MSPSNPHVDSIFGPILQAVQDAPRLAAEATQAATKKILEDLHEENQQAFNTQLKELVSQGYDPRYRYFVAGFFGLREFNPVSNAFQVPGPGTGYHGQPLLYTSATKAQEEEIYEEIAKGRAYIQRFVKSTGQSEIFWRLPHSMEAISAFLRAVSR